MKNVLARLLAVWLVVLVLAPWSAPFSVCDLATFYPPASDELGPGPLDSHRSASVADRSSSHAVPATRTSHRVKFAAALGHASLPIASQPSSRTERRSDRISRPNAPLVSPLRI
jgi:hypothetical protein